jgi:hypothetical protein
MALVARERRATWLALGAISAGAVAVLVHPEFLTHVSREVDTGSINVRFERVAPILGRVAAHPFRGLGLGNLVQSGFTTTDNAYLLEYTEVGAVGVAMLAVVLLVALSQCARALLAASDDDRLIAGACVAAVVAYIASTVFYDAFTLLQGPLLLWLAVAVGTVAAERSVGAARMPRPQVAWLVAAAAASVGVGFAVARLTPTLVAQDALFTTMPAASQVPLGDPILPGDILVATVCDAARVQTHLDPDVRLECRPEPAATGYGRLRVEGPSTAQVVAAATEIQTTMRDRVDDRAFRLFPLAAPSRGRSSVLVTAPAWLPIGVVGLVVLVPWRRARALTAARGPSTSTP